MCQLNNKRIWTVTKSQEGNHNFDANYNSSVEPSGKNWQETLGNNILASPDSYPELPQPLHSFYKLLKEPLLLERL